MFTMIAAIVIFTGLVSYLVGRSHGWNECANDTIVARIRARNAEAAQKQFCDPDSVPRVPDDIMFGGDA